VNENEIEELINRTDKNNGVIEFNEFVELMVSIHTHEERDKHRLARTMERKIPTNRSAGGL